ncbi:hypothetical protein BX600DRAFT_500470 [Xylariales sp. PMI_506]|nr:hypothetical protein BX600DRAFT_500470 [Xylariales sp. PMI_506]
MDLSRDHAQQAVPNGILQIQPGLETALREKVNELPFCDLRVGCTVVDRELSDADVVVTYNTVDGSSRSIRGKWLIGADGKKGIVRKHFLEKSAGIKQVDSAYKYDGTWVAANLKLTLPTPETHPSLPLWKLGYTPEDVYDLFWPIGWHFCSPPGKAIAAGRFGPYHERLWRFEFEQGDWDGSMDAEKLLWEQLDRMLIRHRDTRYQKLPCGEVAFPRDCVEIRRCREFRFTHKVVNKWFDGRTVLIGDAAHVFPPFGGQGIASGVRDAHQLAWRLFLLLRTAPEKTAATRAAESDRLLGMWASERTESVRQAASATKLNGMLCNEGDSWVFWFARSLISLFNSVPFLPNVPHAFLESETRGYSRMEDGFVLKKFGGGQRIPQIYVEAKGYKPVLSDSLLKHSTTVLTLVVLADNPLDLLEEVKTAVRGVGAISTLVSEDSIIFISPNTVGQKGAVTDVYYPSPLDRLVGATIYDGYDPSSFVARLQPDAKYVLVRPDFHIFSQAKNIEELVKCLGEAKRMISAA